MTSRFLHALACGALLLATQAAHALIIEDGMDATALYPFGITDVYPWTRTVFGQTEMSSGAGVLSMSTNRNVGVWFGNGTWIGHSPGWGFGKNAEGTYLNISVKLSTDAADWSLYFFDDSGYEAAIGWNPAGHYDAPVQRGFSYYHAKSDGSAASGFRAMDLDDGFHTFEILARGGQVSYAVDHQLVYRGAARYEGPTQLLVIGDGSATDQTGVGSMLVDRIVLDTAPTMSTLSTVPLPGAAPLLAGGLALLTLRAGRRRRLPASEV